MPSWHGERAKLVNSVTERMIRIFKPGYILTTVTPWRRVVLEKLTVAQLVENSLLFMEPIGPLQFPQEQSASSLVFLGFVKLFCSF
jgi:hypothetical protein